MTERPAMVSEISVHITRRAEGSMPCVFGQTQPTGQRQPEMRIATKASHNSNNSSNRATSATQGIPRNNRSTQGLTTVSSARQSIAPRDRPWRVRPGKRWTGRQQARYPATACACCRLHTRSNKARAANEVEEAHGQQRGPDREQPVPRPSKPFNKLAHDRLRRVKPKAEHRA